MKNKSAFLFLSNLADGGISRNLLLCLFTWLFWVAKCIKEKASHLVFNYCRCPSLFIQTRTKTTQKEPKKHLTVNNSHYIELHVILRLASSFTLVFRNIYYMKKVLSLNQFKGNESLFIKYFIYIKIYYILGRKNLFWVLLVVFRFLLTFYVQCKQNFKA